MRVCSLVFLSLTLSCLQVAADPGKNQLSQSTKRVDSTGQPLEKGTAEPKTGTCPTVAGLECKESTLLEGISEDDRARPWGLQAVYVFGIFFAFIVSAVALFFNWYTTFIILFKIYRRMKIMENKMCVAQEKFDKRAFPEALIGKLSNMANFDFTANQNEAETMLKSMAGGTFVH